MKSYAIILLIAMTLVSSQAADSPKLDFPKVGETYRIHMSDLGKRDAAPVSKSEYERLRRDAMSEGVRSEQTLRGQRREA